MPDQIFRLLPNQENQTVSALLRQWLPDKSWGEIRRLLRARQVMVSGNLCVDAGRRLKLQDVVKVLPHPSAPPPRQEDIRVRHLDEHVVVVEKPAGMTTIRHLEERNWPARRKQLQPTLDELLPHVIARIDAKHRGRGVPPPVRAVHRLDRETSGLMVFARTVRAERHLGEQFRRHTTHRRYLAIVEGRVEARTISTRLIRDRGDGRRGGTTDEEIGKHAVTHVRPLETVGWAHVGPPLDCKEISASATAGRRVPTLREYTLLECRLETGRTHQIRIHLAELGHPVCGEKIYRQSASGRDTPDHSGAPRLALHAAELGFEHPMTGEQLRFSMPLPPDLREFWERLHGK